MMFRTAEVFNAGQHIAIAEIIIPCIFGIIFIQIGGHARLFLAIQCQIHMHPVIGIRIGRGVRAIAAINDIAMPAAIKHIIASPAGHSIASGATAQPVIAIPAIEGIITAAARQTVITCPARDSIIIRRAGNMVIIIRADKIAEVPQDIHLALIGKGKAIAIQAATCLTRRDQCGFGIPAHHIAICRIACEQIGWRAAYIHL